MGISGGRKKVIIESSALPPFQFFGQIEINNNLILAQNININDDHILLNSGHGFQVGEHITLHQDNIFEQLEVIAINIDGNPNKIKVEVPVANLFTVSNTRVIRGDTRLNKNGSTSPIEFCMKLYNTIMAIDVSSVIISMRHGLLVPDDGKFGGIPQLEKGLYFRKMNGVSSNLGNYRSNMDFKNRKFSVKYTDKAPAGQYATEIIMDIENIFRNTLRISTINDEYVIGTIRDNLSSGAGIDYLKISVIGKYTIGE